MATTARPRESLESGDRLTREEFHRRYSARPDIGKAELVRGVVYVPSPTRAEEHAEPHGSIMLWLGTYKSRTPGVRMADNATVFLPDGSEVQPDACLYRLGAPGARIRITPDGYLEGTPDLVVEVAASSASYDLHDKLEAYRRSGVREYIVWRVLDQAIDWMRLEGEQYHITEPDAAGIIASAAFPGLRLAVTKMLAGDDAGVLAVLG